MKIDGVDIKKCETSTLLKNRKMYLSMVPVYFLFSLFVKPKVFNFVITNHDNENYYLLI